MISNNKHYYPEQYLGAPYGAPGRASHQLVKNIFYLSSLDKYFYIYNYIFYLLP